MKLTERSNILGAIISISFFLSVPMAIGFAGYLPVGHRGADSYGLVCPGVFSLYVIAVMLFMVLSLIVLHFFELKKCIYIFHYWIFNIWQCPTKMIAMRISIWELDPKRFKRNQMCIHGGFGAIIKDKLSFCTKCTESKRIYV